MMRGDTEMKRGKGREGEKMMQWNLYSISLLHIYIYMYIHGIWKR